MWWVATLWDQIWSEGPHTSGRTSFSKSAPALLPASTDLTFCSLAKCLHQERWDKEKLWGWSQYISPSSLLNTDICSAPVPHFCYGVLQKNWDLTGWESRWSLNQSQRVCESWQTDCELGEMNLEQKNDTHGEAWGAQTKTQANL